MGKGQIIFKGALVGDMLVLIGGYIVGGFFLQHIGNIFPAWGQDTNLLKQPPSCFFAAQKKMEDNELWELLSKVKLQKKWIETYYDL